MKKRTRVVLISLGLLVVLGIAGGIVISKMVDRFSTYLDTVEIIPVDISAIGDGTYRGIVDTGVILVELEARIENHRIVDIRLLKHRNGQGEEAVRIIPRILEEQRIDVDTITGATYSSLVIQDALSRALRQ